MTSKKSLPTPNNVRIIGIDPGYDRLGISVVDKIKGKKEVLVHSECFQTSSKEDIHNRLFDIGKRVEYIIDKYKPNIIAIENLFITKNQKTAMRVSEARGIILYQAVKSGLKIHEYSPMEIKTSVTGDGNSDKTAIIRMVKMLIDIPDKKTLDDEYDAIAVALTCSATIRV